MIYGKKKRTVSRPLLRFNSGGNLICTAAKRLEWLPDFFGSHVVKPSKIRSFKVNIIRCPHVCFVVKIDDACICCDARHMRCLIMVYIDNSRPYLIWLLCYTLRLTCKLP